MTNESTIPRTYSSIESIERFISSSLREGESCYVVVFGKKRGEYDYTVRPNMEDQILDNIHYYIKISPLRPKKTQS